MAPAEDPQRELVYFWENHNFHSLFYDCRMPLRDARKMARKMAKLFAIRAPEIKECRQGKNGNTAETCGEGKSIRVNTDKARWTPMLLAHEMAHIICEVRDVRGQDHGPTWMGIYMRLLDKFKIIPAPLTVALARAYGIKFKDPTRCF